jgi:hypothetical protein
MSRGLAALGLAATGRGRRQHLGEWCTEDLLEREAALSGGGGGGENEREQERGGGPGHRNLGARMRAGEDV